jgi:hypothetical protein
MQYDRLRSEGLDIAMGAVEGATAPACGGGRQRAELVLHLRCILVSGLWSDFVAFLAEKCELKLRAQPIEAIPHAAAA